MDERSKSLDFGSELEIAQVQILSVGVALFISTINLVLYRLSPLFCLIRSSQQPSCLGRSQTFIINHSGSVVYHLDRMERGLTSVFRAKDSPEAKTVLGSVANLNVISHSGSVVYHLEGSLLSKANGQLESINGSSNTALGKIPSPKVLRTRTN
ncbi:hypothetical protein J6590_057651 [Homalodisca vitripennis]|nr:hypothetical protein J6590_057651 [Homalodisca vitripennis]